MTKAYMHVTGASSPQRFLLIADWGLSQNSSVTLQHILMSAANTTSAPAVLYIADFCYAGQSFHPALPSTSVVMFTTDICYALGSSATASCL